MRDSHAPFALLLRTRGADPRRSSRFGPWVSRQARLVGQRRRASQRLELLPLHSRPLQKAFR
jgi:hypothetical protein